MKEMLNSDIRIEDRELRSLIKYEQIVAWHKSGGFKRASAAYHAEIAEAERQKAIAELWVSQINVIEQVAAKFESRAIRNAQISAVAAKHRADAAERLAIQEACDEVMALEEIVRADDIDDILSEVSKALGIELPTDADRPDNCQRGHKSIEDRKRELGPSLANPVRQMQAAEADVVKAEELIADVRRASLLQGLEAAPMSERFFEVGQDRVKAERVLLDFVKRLAAKAHGLADEPIIMLTNCRTVGAWFRPDGTDKWLPFSPEDKVTIPDHVLDEATLDASCRAAIEAFDAGKTLEQLGWSPPPYEPPKPPDSIASWEQAVMRVAS